MTLIQIGLLLDIAGALLLARFGLPEKIDPEGHVLLWTGGVDQTEVKKTNKYKMLSRLSLVLLFLGFLLQFLGTL